MTLGGFRNNAVQGCSKHFVKKVSPMWKEIGSCYFCLHVHENMVISLFTGLWYECTKNILLACWSFSLPDRYWQIRI